MGAILVLWRKMGAIQVGITLEIKGLLGSWFLVLGSWFAVLGADY